MPQSSPSFFSSAPVSAKTHATEAAVRKRSEADLLSILFRKLDDNGVRYCVLHSWESLPNAIGTDLDIGVHPNDKEKLAVTLAEVRTNGYVPVQSLNYFVNAYYLVFAWFEEEVARFAALDIIFEHRRGGLIVPNGEALVASRRREKTFWIPDPATEFAYLLSKKTWKQFVAAKQVRRLQSLVTILGTSKAEHVAEQLFGQQMSRQVIAAITAGTIGGLIPKLGWQTWGTSFRRNPFKAVRYVVEDAWRKLQRWEHPTGLLVAFVGPDGVGKSTVISRVKHIVSKPFRREKVFHWRPGIIRKGQLQVGPVSPHQHPPRTALKSSAFLLVQFIDYWLGYILRIRPLLARSTFVLFDRYFYDIQTDPLRFRFGGPMWLPRLLGKFVPRPDLLFVLDAPERAILDRKQELGFQEIQRQRAEYGLLTKQLRNTTVISTAADIEAATNVLSSVLVDFLAKRFQRQTSALHLTRRYGQE